jgi:hypothetical protein
VLVTVNASELSAGEPRQFATTRWSLILSAAHSENGDQKARAALEELCRTYWRPIFSFVCRRGYSVENAHERPEIASHDEETKKGQNNKGEILCKRTPSRSLVTSIRASASLCFFA